MHPLPPLSTPELQPGGGPRLALDRQLCQWANRWGTRRAVGLLFGTVSRLGDGLFWYALMGAIAVLGGHRGAWVATHMAAFAVPRHVRIGDEIPRNRTGKIDKLALRETMELELQSAAATR